MSNFCPTRNNHVKAISLKSSKLKHCLYFLVNTPKNASRRASRSQDIPVYRREDLERLSTTAAESLICQTLVKEPSFRNSYKGSDPVLYLRRCQSANSSRSVSKKFIISVTELLLFSVLRRLFYL